MKRTIRECLAIVRGVLEPLGCTVEAARHNKHKVVDVHGPAGQRASICLASSPKSEDDAKNFTRQDARRVARSWGLLS